MKVIGQRCWLRCNRTPAGADLFDAAHAKGMSILVALSPYDSDGTILAANCLHPDTFGPNMGRGYSGIIEIATQEPLARGRHDEMVKSPPATGAVFVTAPS